MAIALVDFLNPETCDLSDPQNTVGVASARMPSRQDAAPSHKARRSSTVIPVERRE